MGKSCLKSDMQLRIYINFSVNCHDLNMKTFRYKICERLAGNCVHSICFYTSMFRTTYSETLTKQLARFALVCRQMTYENINYDVPENHCIAIYNLGHFCNWMNSCCLLNLILLNISTQV